MKNPFRKSRTFKQMSASQLKEFNRSYKSYEKYYAKISSPFEQKLSRDEYFEAYKYTYNELKSQGKTTAALPRKIAAEQKYERSYAQDRAQFHALKETDNFKKMHGDMSFQEFRRIQNEDLESFLWSEIDAYKRAAKELGDSDEEINLFISQYYFGSP